MQMTGMLQRGVTGPARLALWISELGLETGLGVVRAARGILTRDRPGTAPPARFGAASPPPPRRPTADPGPGTAPPARFGAASPPPPRRPTADPGDPPAAPEAVSPPPPVPPARAAGPAVPVAAAPAGAKGIDDEPVKVGEFGEAGAEDDAGANVRVEAPWDGYDGMTATQIQGRIAAADRETVAAVALYEGSARARRSVIRAADKRLRLLSA